MPGEQVGSAYVSIGIDKSKLQSEIAGAKNEIKNGWGDVGSGLSSSLSKGDYKGIGSKIGSDLVSGISGQFGMLGSLGGQIATALGPAGVAALGIGAGVAVAAQGIASCVSAAASWETQMVSIKKVLDDVSDEDFSKLSSDLLDIQARTGMSQEEISGAAAGAGRMGIDTSEIAEYTETILMMADAWDVPAESASNAIGKMGSVLKSEDTSWGDFARSAGSAINDLADSMATSEESIVTGVSKLGSTMAMLKPSDDQIASWYALTAQLQAFGMTSSTSGESIKDAFTYMMRDTGDIAELLDMDTSDFQSAIRDDAIGTVQELAVAISELPVEEQGEALALFGSTGAQAMGMLAGKVDPITGEIEGLSSAIEVANAAWESGSSLTDSYAEKQDTLNAQFDIFGGKISTIKTKIGGELLPAFTDFMTSVNSSIDTFIEWGEKGWSAAQKIDEALSPLGGVGGIAGKAKDTLLGTGVIDSAKMAYDAWSGLLSKDWTGAGEELGGSITDGIDAGTEEVPKNLEETFEDVDAEGAGESVGKRFGDALSDEAKKSYEYSLSNLLREGDARTYDTGTIQAGESEVVLKHSTDGQRLYYVSVDGESLGDFSTADAAAEALMKAMPSVWDAIEKTDWDIAALEATGKTLEAAEMRATVAANIEFKSTMRSALTAKNEAVVEWAKEDAEAYKDAFEDAMEEGIILDWDTAWADMGEQAIDAFADNLISGAEALNMIDLYDALEIADPAKFEEMGGEAGRALWQGLYDALAAQADYIADLPVGVEADPAKLQELQDDIVAAAEAVQPIEVSVELDSSQWGEWNTEMNRALFGVEHSGMLETVGYQMESDLYSLAEKIYNAGDEASKTVQESLDMLFDPSSFDYDQEVFDLALANVMEYVESLEGVDFDPTALAAAFKKWFNEGVSEGLETADDWTKYLTDFGTWQENVEGLFDLSYAGPTEGYAGRGLGAKAGYESQNYFTYGIKVDTAEADADLQELNTEATKTAEKSITTNISDALLAAKELNAELEKSITKTVTVDINVTGEAGAGIYSESIENYLSFAEGGIVSNPMLAWVGDNPNSSEVVAPLNKLVPIIETAVQNSAGGGSRVQIGQIGPFYETNDAEATATEVVKKLEQRICQSYEGDGFNG